MTVTQLKPRLTIGGSAAAAAYTYIDPVGARRCRARNRDAMRRRASRV